MTQMKIDRGARSREAEPTLLKADALSTGAAGAALGAVVGFVIAPGAGAAIGSVVGALLGGGIGAANTHSGH